MVIWVAFAHFWHRFTFGWIWRTHHKAAAPLGPWTHFQGHSPGPTVPLRSGESTEKEASLGILINPYPRDRWKIGIETAKSWRSGVLQQLLQHEREITAKSHPRQLMRSHRHPSLLCWPESDRDRIPSAGCHLAAARMIANHRPDTAQALDLSSNQPAWDYGCPKPCLPGKSLN